MTGWEVLGRGVLFGLGAAVPIGPINVEIARRALLRGWTHGFCLGLGAVSVDVAYACVASAGVSVVADGPWIFWPLSVAGIALLTWLGWGCLRAAIKAWREGWSLPEVEGAAPRLARVYGTGVLMTAVNPMTLAVWFVVLPGQAMAQCIARNQLAFLAAGVFVGTVSWVLSFSSLMALLGRFRRAWWMALADLAGGLVLLAFAALSLVVCLRRLTS